MKSRLAILGMLVAGMLFSTAGAGLAVSGITQSGSNAAVSQYATPTPTCTPTPPDTGPSGRPGGGSSDGSGTVTPAQADCGDGGVLAAEDDNAPARQSQPASESGGGVLPAQDTTQPARQQAAAATTSQLPFTGFAAIPVLLGGLALLSGGLILRRRTK